ncbi:protein kinase [uncultured Rubinisphaera sp.]|uniref:protein kinase domain-containing protein n=1 Tax=uncultured Rubinisphaera sp. TaxID=1678686 RepID=UPI0030DA4578
MNFSTDHNLLIGVIAYNNGFVDQNQLIQAMNQWVLDKSKSLAEVMQSQSAITVEERELILALAERHLEKFGGDAEKTLQQLSSISSVKTHLETIQDSDLQKSLNTLHNQPTHQSGTSGTEENQGGGQGYIRFHKIRSHAQGGLGEVFVAEDIELSRHVALKEIKGNAKLSPADKVRFLREAEVTGQLEHPGIVPVYGLGSYADGRPFYAMKFIKGDSLQKAISNYHNPETSGRTPEQKLFQLRQLLQRFIDVCNAMHYAHSRGVLHRDLKPGNIMVGKYGETLVVDWGLARLQGEASEILSDTEGPQILSGSVETQTLDGTLLGTPAYMPPEQAMGTIDQLNATSDVYSLGATLYELLTGQAPFVGKQLTELLKKVRRGNFPKPTEIEKDIPKPLEAICLTAMKLNQADRYQSAAQLAEDLERWLADEPVNVWKESFSIRLGRWVKRHRTLFTSVATSALVLIAALTVGMLLLNAARNREAAAREMAETNFRMAKEAVDQFYIRVSEEVLLDQPGLQAVREEMLKEALEYYKRFLEQRSDDPLLQEDQALTMYYQGQILGEIESPEQSLKVLRESEELQKKQLERNANDPLQKYRLSNIQNAIASQLTKEQKWKEAEESFKNATSLRQQLVDEFPENTEYQRKLANTLMNFGLVEMKTGSPEKALESVGKSQTVRESSLKQDAENVLILRDFAMGYFNQAMLQLEQKQVATAVESLQNAADVFAKVVAKQPQDFRIQLRLAQTKSWLSELLWFQKQQQQAKVLNEESRKLLEMLVMSNPDVAEYHSALARLLMNRARWHQQSNETDAAVASFEAAIKQLRIIVDGQSISEAPNDHRDLAVSLSSLSKLLQESDPEKANALREESYSILEQLLKAFPENSDFQKIKEKLSNL